MGRIMFIYFYFQDLFYLVLHAYVFNYVWVWAYEYILPWRLEDSLRFPGVIGGLGLPAVGTGNQTQVLHSSSTCPKPQSHLSRSCLVFIVAPNRALTCEMFTEWYGITRRSEPVNCMCLYVPIKSLLPVSGPWLVFTIIFCLFTL